MFELFSAIKNQIVLSQNFADIHWILRRWNELTWNAASNSYDTTVDKSAIIDSACERLVDWHIALNSCDISLIIAALEESKGVYYDAYAITEVGLVDYIALHKTSNNEVTPYIHTVLISRMAKDSKLFPLFLNKGRVCIGSKPVSIGVMRDFHVGLISSISNSETDNFTEIQKFSY